MNAEQAKKLREPFSGDAVSTLPKPYKRDSQKGTCRECGGYHGLPAVHLDYVGHADVTDRLLAVDPEWSWEPLALDENGLPAFDHLGGLWIRLTVCGVSRLGYGDAQGKTGANAIKECIGDGIRNAAMRFGVALDLWRKEWKAEAAAESPTPPEPMDTDDWQRRVDMCDGLTPLAALATELGRAHQAGAVDDTRYELLVEYGKQRKAELTGDAA